MHRDDTRLEKSEYVEHLQRESRRFRDLLADTDPSAPVPACPAWTAGDLLWHLAGVQRFWAGIVSSRPAGPPEDAEEAKRPETHADLLADFDESSAALVAALEAAEPKDECWTWSDDKSVAFVLRRQALEAVVHRFDAEQAAGLDLTEVDARLATDGIHEVLDVMYGGCPPWGDFSPLPHYVRIDATDTDSSVWVQLGRFSGTDPKDEVRYEEDDIHVVDDPGVEPDAVIEGTAEVLLARLWRRGDGADIHIAGDMLIVDHFRSAIHHPIE